MIRLARAQPEIAVLSFDLRCATPVLPVATGRNVSSPPRSLPKQAFNATPQQTASTEIPIASDARSLHTSRGFLPWRFAYAGPRCAPRHLHGAGIRKPSQFATSITDGSSVSGDRKLKESTPRLAPGRPQPPPMGFDNRVADREAHAHAFGLGRVEWLEQTREVIWAEPGAGVPHPDAYATFGRNGIDADL